MTWQWDVIDDPGDMERLAAPWDAAAARIDGSAFARPAFALAYGAAFVPVPRGLVLSVLRRDGELMAVLPLVRRGRLARVWTSFDNDHAPVGDLVLRADVPEAGARVLHHLLARGDELVCARLAADGTAYRALRAAASELGVAVATAEAGADTYLRLAPWPEFEAAMPRKLRASIRVRLSRLERAGRVAFRRVERGAALASALEECFAVEAAGWKGASGSPITRHRATRRFYSELAARASAAGQLALYVLELDGAIIAFRLALRAAGRCDSLKTGYRPEWAAYGPGVLTKFLMARREIADGDVRALHFGFPSEDKLRWSSGVTRLVTLRVYAPTSRGRLARATPALLDTLDRWRPAAAALARGRAAFARLKAGAHRARVRLGKLRRHRDTARVPRASALPAAVTMRPLTRPSDPRPRPS